MLRLVFLCWYVELLWIALGAALTRQEKLRQDGKAPPLWVYAVTAVVLSFLAPLALLLAGLLGVLGKIVRPRSD